MRNTSLPTTILHSLRVVYTPLHLLEQGGVKKREQGLCGLGRTGKRHTPTQGGCGTGVPLTWAGGGGIQDVRLKPDVHGCSFTMEIIIIFLIFFRVAPMVCGRSQVRDLIGATTAGLQHSHSNSGCKPFLQPTPQLMATLDPRDSLSEARDGTCSLMITSRMRIH